MKYADPDFLEQCLIYSALQEDGFDRNELFQLRSLPIDVHLGA